MIVNKLIMVLAFLFYAFALSGTLVVATAALGDLLWSSDSNNDPIGTCSSFLRNACLSFYDIEANKQRVSICILSLHS